MHRFSSRGGPPPPPPGPVARDIPSDDRAERLEEIAALTFRRDQLYLDLRQLRPDQARRFQPIAARHANAQQDDVGPERPGLLERLEPVACLADDLVAPLFDQLHEPRAG